MGNMDPATEQVSRTCFEAYTRDYTFTTSTGIFRSCLTVLIVCP